MPNTCPCSEGEHEASSEKPKSTLEHVSQDHGAFATSRKVALRECVLVHFLPVSITIGVLQLSFCSVYWADPTAYQSFNEILNSLQYAAKALEILIVCSMSRIVQKNSTIGIYGRWVRANSFESARSGFLVITQAEIEKRKVGVA